LASFVVNLKVFPDIDVPAGLTDQAVAAVRAKFFDL
jgi:hypothetical protein